MEGKSSLIFMRDDGKTLRWRMGPTTLRVLAAMLALLPLVTAGSLWLNWKLLQDRRAVLAENAGLRDQVEANAHTVARLSGLERYLRQSAPSSLDQLAQEGDAAPASPEHAPEVSTETPVLPTNAPQTDTTARPDTTLDAVTPMVADASQTEGGDAAPDIAEAGDGQTAESATAAPASPEVESASAEPAVMTTAADLEPVDTGLARVERLQARRVGPRSLRVSFDLYNSQQVPQLAGRAAFHLLLPDGRAFPLDAHGDTTYRINRLKKIVGNPTLPAEVTEAEGALIVVSVYAGEDVIYRTTTPLQQ